MSTIETDLVQAATGTNTDDPANITWPEEPES